MLSLSLSRRSWRTEDEATRLLRFVTANENLPESNRQKLTDLRWRVKWIHLRNVSIANETNIKFEYSTLNGMLDL